MERQVPSGRVCGVVQEIVLQQRKEFDMSEAVDRFVQELNSRIDPAKAAGMTAVYQFVMTDVPEGVVHADISNGQVMVKAGASPNPSITFSASTSDWLALLQGQLNGQMAFLTGKLKIQGDMTLALKLQSLFRMQ